MPYEITRVDVWSGEIEDRPGALATKLEAIMRAGANLDFVVARPSQDKPGYAVLFVAPLVGPEQTAAAAKVRLKKSSSMHSLRIVGPDRIGLGAGIARALADAGVNITGVSAAAVGDQSIFYLRFENDDDTKRAAQVLTRILS